MTDPLPKKGIFGGKCNRTACTNVGANWYSPVEQAHYCEACAKSINEWLPLGVAPMYKVTSWLSSRNS